MPQLGHLHFYSACKAKHADERIRLLLAALEPDRIGEAFLTTRPSRDWRRFRRSLRRGVLDYTPSKMLPEMTPDRLASLYRPNRCISVFLYGSPLSDAISHAVEEGIPEEVRGSFIPFDLTIRAGWHDVFETTENPEGQLFVRALFSVRFKGNGTPHDWKETRRRILALPVINETLERLRAPLGDPKVVVYWHA